MKEIMVIFASEQEEKKIFIYNYFRIIFSVF